METLRHDLRYAFRSLRKSPGFTGIVVLTLALGIGATAAIFSVISALLLRPLPYEDPARLVRLYETGVVSGNTFQGSVSVPNFRDWREQTRAFEALAAFSGGDLNLQGVDNPVRLSAVSATANLFSLLGARPLLGRTFAPDEDAPGAPPVAVLSESLWKRRFGADREVIGRSITLDGEVHTVIGVMPGGFRFPAGARRTDVWVPLRFVGERSESRGSHWMAVLGRLASDIGVSAAQEEMSRIARGIEQRYPDSQEDRGILLVPLKEVVTGDLRPALLILMGAAGLVLLIACANAANLLLARAAARRREVALHAALGAGRGRIIRRFLVEALLLASGGAVVGLILALGGVGALVALVGENMPRAAEIGFDVRLLAFLLAAAVATAVGFGLAPALQTTGAGLHDELREGGGKASTGPGGRRFRAALVVGQIALSLVLLVGAGLLMKTLASLLDTETGMVTENVLTMNVAVPEGQYPEGTAVDGFFRPVLERVRALAGVRAAGWITHLPLQEAWTNGGFGIEGRPEDEGGFAELRGVSPGYFAALGIPVRRGRAITPRDGAGSPPVAVVNQALAERYFPNENPVGRRILRGGPPIEIVGIVGDVRQAELSLEPMPELYFPYTQRSRGKMTLVVSTGVPPTSLTGAVRAAILEVDPDQPVFNVRTMEQVVARSVSGDRTYMWLLATFAGVALVLAGAGIYGVISYSVTQRTREIGIRVALGAGSASVLGLIMRQGATLAITGLLIGAAAGLALTRLLASSLYGVSPTDPFTFIAVALLLAGVALLATYVPARRAARVDPLVALRAE